MKDKVRKNLQDFEKIKFEKSELSRIKGGTDTSTSIIIDDIIESHH